MSLKKFYLDPYLHVKAFTAQALLTTLACVALWAFHSPAFYAFHLRFWQVPVYLLLAVYVGGMSAVFIHNATHNSFPNPVLNAIGGHLAGMHQLWSFTGWRLIHLVHHHYSDDHEGDPHPPRGRTFWRYMKDMFVQSSHTINRRYREHWKDFPRRTAFLQRATLIVFFWMWMGLVTFWYLLLGPAAFLFFYLPSLAFNHWFFTHINYYCHPADANGRTAPTNLTQGVYFRVANIIWCGIYYHGNHHRRPMLFNPRKLTQPVRSKVEANA